MSQQVEFTYQYKMNELLTKIHHKLKKGFPFIQDSIELNEEQNQSLELLDPQTIQYKNFVALLAINAYTDHVSDTFDQADAILSILWVCLTSMKQLSKLKLGSVWSNDEQKNVFSTLQQGLLKLGQYSIHLSPNSEYVGLCNNLIQKSEQSNLQSVQIQLLQQNLQLKERLRFNDQKIINLQVRLTKIQQQHMQCDGSTPIEETLRFYELQDILNAKNNEIQRMNEQFSIEINKYNTVYEQMKRQLSEYKNYGNIDTVQMIGKLQTQIILLRQQKYRQQQTNQYLRSKLQVASYQCQPLPHIFSPKSSKNNFYKSLLPLSNGLRQSYQKSQSQSRLNAQLGGQRFLTQNDVLRNQELEGKSVRQQYTYNGRTTSQYNLN